MNRHYEPRLLPCEPPRSPQLALAAGAAVPPLAAALRHLADRSLGALACAYGDGVLVVEGPAEQLPWVPGVRYLAGFSDAPELYVPTYLTLNVPPALMLRALRRDYAGRLAWLPSDDEGHVLIQLDGLASPGRIALGELSQRGPG